MMDTAWGVGAVSAPTMTGCNSVFPDSVTNGYPFNDDEIEDMIDDLGFFQDKDDTFKSSTEASMSIMSMPPMTKYATVSGSTSPAHDNNNDNDNDTRAVVIAPDLTISTTQRQRDAGTGTGTGRSRSSSTHDHVDVALPQPPRLLTNQNQHPHPQSRVTSCSTAQTVLKQQQETILQNQRIIDAQRSELRGQIHNKTACQSQQQPIAVAVTSSPVPVPVTTKIVSATYPLARAALKKADEQVININGSKKRKVSSLSSSDNDHDNGNGNGNSPTTTTEANAYQKWKLTPAGATKLRAVDSGGIKHCRNAKQQHQDDVSGKHFNPGELEVRRERNRKHAKKSRLRKKSLTSTLEQSLESLREENTKLRKRIEDHIAKKQEAAATAAKSVDTLLEEHRVRSHERFIDCIRNVNVNATTNTGSSDSDSDSNTKNNESNDTDTVTVTDTDSKTNGENPSFDTKTILSSSTGRGIVVDDKTLKILKGLSKSIASGANNKQQNQ